MYSRDQKLPRKSVAAPTTVLTIHALKTKIPVKELAFNKGKRRKAHSIVSHQIGLPDLSEYDIHVHMKRRKRQEDERRRLAEYRPIIRQIKHDNPMPSDQIILSDDQNKEQIANAQERNDGSYELTLRKSSMLSTSCQKTYYKFTAL